MNVLAIVHMLEEALAVYQELQSSGLLADIAASVEKDKEIIGKLEANARLTELIKTLTGFVAQHNWKD